MTTYSRIFGQNKLVFKDFYILKNEGHNVWWVRKEKGSGKTGDGNYYRNMLYETSKEQIKNYDMPPWQFEGYVLV